MSNDTVAVYSVSVLRSCYVLSSWSISTGEQRLHREFERKKGSYGVAISSCGGVVMYGRDEGIEIAAI